MYYLVGFVSESTITHRIDGCAIHTVIKSNNRSSSSRFGYEQCVPLSLCHIQKFSHLMHISHWKKKRQRLFEYGWFSCRMHFPLEKLNFTNFHSILITMVFTTDYLSHHHPDFRKSHSASIEIAPLLQIIIIQFKETFKRQSDLTTSHSNLIHSIIPNWWCKHMYLNRVKALVPDIERCFTAMPSFCDITTVTW